MIKTILRNAINIFPDVAALVRNLRDQLDQRQHPIKSPWGFTLAGHPTMARGDFEPEETAIVRRLLQDVDVLVNVGANVGYYCCHALSLHKPVIAVEPIARNLHYLLENIRRNGWANQAEVFPVAMGNSTDILQMWGGDRRISRQGLGRRSRDLRDSSSGVEPRPCARQNPARQEGFNFGGYRRCGIHDVARG